MSDAFRRTLRALPDFPAELPGFDPTEAPADPVALFKQWLQEALAAGVPQPHAFSLATADGHGQPSARMLILKDIDDDGWHFATSRTSRKGRELTANPKAALNFFWPQQGRQVRVAGPVVELSAGASEADWQARPAADGSTNPQWQLYAVQPAEFEFWQASHDRRHIRHRYGPEAIPLSEDGAMTAPAPADLLAELHEAADLAVSTTSTFTDADVTAPSALPGWTRGHVLAHLAGISNAMARQLEFAARGQTIELYDGGQEGRDRAIGMAAGHDARTHKAELRAGLGRALTAFDSLGDGLGWQVPIAYRGGVVLDGGLALWRELVIHTADLNTGVGPETWSRPFCEHLFDFLAARVGPGDRLVLQPLGLPRRTLGSGSRSIVISGMVTDIAAWLAGREPSLGSLRASAAADGVNLPELLPWPSGAPAVR